MMVNCTVAEARHTRHFDFYLSTDPASIHQVHLIEYLTEPYTDADAPRANP